MSRRVLKSISILMMLILSVASLSAIDLGTGVSNVGFDGEFGYGIVPCFAEYNFWIKGMPQLIKGNSTWMDFNFKSGYVEREDYDTDIDYGSISGYMDAVFTQGFQHNKYNGSDMYRVWLSYAVRMEQAMPCIDDVVDNSYDRFKGLRCTFDDYVDGDIDHIDNMKEMANIIGLGVDFPWAISQLAGYNNFNFGFSFRTSPKFINECFQGIFEVPIDYRIYSVYMNRYLTIYEKAQEKHPNLNFFSIMQENNMSYRYLEGDYVPKFAGGTTFMNSFYDNYSVTFFGPYMGSDQSYVFLKTGLSSSFSFGPKTNGKSDNINWEFDSDLYIKLHVRLFNIFHAELNMSHEFYFADDSGAARWLRDNWEFPSFVFYISL